MIGGLVLRITETILNTWIIMAVLIAFAIVVRVKIRRFKDIPRGFQNVVEYMVEAFDNFLRSAAGEKLMFLGNWFFMVFCFVLLSNISGLFFLRPPTADWATNITLALVTFFLIHILGGKMRKTGYLKEFFKPNAVFLPINLIGEIARPISLSFRLFGNILAGTILLGLIYKVVFLRYLVPAPLHAFFDLFAGAIQTYVFCMLSFTYISGATTVEEQ